MHKTLITAVAAAALLSTAAFAQTAAPAQWFDIDDDQGITVLGLTVDQVEDMDVFDAAGVRLAEVEEVLGTDATTPTALAIDLDGQGPDDIDVVIALTDVTVENGRLTTALTVEQLRALPVWND